MVLAINNRSGDYVIARTTSAPRASCWSPGCHNDSVEPNYFIPASMNIFRKDTWICLDYFLDFDIRELDEKISSGKIRKILSVPVGELALLVDCAARSEDASNNQEGALRDFLASLE